MKAYDKGTDFPIPAAGAGPMRCVQIIDLGTTLNRYGKDSRQLYMGFELPGRNYSMPDKENPGQNITRVHVIGSFFTLALSPKANLRKFLEAWLGRPMSADTAKKGFDMKLLMDKVAYGHIMHETKDDGSVKAQISTVMPMPSEIICPARSTSLIYFSLDPDDFNADSFNGLSKYFQERVRQSHEYAELTGQPTHAAAGMAPAGAGGFVDDDIPFMRMPNLY
jgi:hypothetical protein